MTHPALEARKLKLGLYRDQATGKIIKTIEDVKGAVVDWKGNVVLSLEDIDAGVFGPEGKEKKKSMLGKVLSLATSPYRLMFKTAMKLKDKLFGGGLLGNVKSLLSN